MTENDVRITLLIDVHGGVGTVAISEAVKDALTQSALTEGVILRREDGYGMVPGLAEFAMSGTGAALGALFSKVIRDIFHRNDAKIVYYRFNGEDFYMEGYSTREVERLRNRFHSDGGSES
jgi:hypothetical protein